MESDLEYVISKLKEFEEYKNIEDWVKFFHKDFNWLLEILYQKYIEENDMKNIKLLNEKFPITTCCIGELLYSACESANEEMIKFIVDKSLDIIRNNSHIIQVFFDRNLISDKISMIQYFISKGLDLSSFECYTEYIIEKSKERSDVLRESLISKYYSPENIEKWSVYLNKPFDEVIEVM